MARPISNLSFKRRTSSRENFAGTLHSSSLLNLRKNRSKSLFPAQHTPKRRLHTSLTVPEKNKNNNSSSSKKNSGSGSNNSKPSEECVPLNEMYKNVDVAAKSKKEESRCHAKKAKCEPPKPAAQHAKKRAAKRMSKCRETCLPRGVCQEPKTPKPPKMEYKSSECPSPKYVPLEPCPAIPSAEEEVEVDVESNSNNWKEVCPPPPPLPGPPHGPIVLCPCPPPSKLRPGPCPRHHQRTLINTPPAVRTCPPKGPYPCPDLTFYCPIKKMECELRKPCKTKKKKDS